MKKNKFSKALKHIKKDLNEVAPTNSMSGVYSLNDPGYSLRHPSAPKTFLPDIDGNFPSGIPGNTGTPYIRPAGIWTGEKDWDEIITANFGHDQQGTDGNSTAGLIAENGVVYTALPPNSRSYILGPLVDGFVYNHGHDAYTRIGYIQKDTRQFVLLAIIRGTWKTNFPQESGASTSNVNFPVWDGTTVDPSSGFHSYGSMTLADAQWMRSEIIAGRYMKNTAYRSSGGIGQILGGLGGLLDGLGSFYQGAGVGGGSGDAAVAGSGGGGGYGQGGDPTIGDQQTDPPKKGDAEDAGFPWFPFGKLGKKAKELWDNITDGLGDIKDNMEEFFNDAFDDSVQGAKDFRDSLQDALNNWSGDIQSSIKGQNPHGIEPKAWAKMEPEVRKKLDASFSKDFPPDNNFKKQLEKFVDAVKRLPDAIDAIPASASALKHYMDNNNPNHPNYRVNDPESDNYKGPLDLQMDGSTADDMANRINKSLSQLNGGKGPKGNELTAAEITELSNLMKPDRNGDMQFHTLINSLPTGNRANGKPWSTVKIDDDGTVEIITNYRFSDIDDVSSGGPVIKAWVTNRMKADKESGSGTYPFYKKDDSKGGGHGSADNPQVGSTHDIEVRLNLKKSGNKSNWKNRHHRDVMNFKTLKMSYQPEGKFLKESYGLRRVKFVMEDVAAAPAPTTPTNQTTTQQPTESKQTADALAKEYIEKNGPEKTQELIDKTDEYLSAHGQDPEHHSVEPTEPTEGEEVDMENLKSKALNLAANNKLNELTDGEKQSLIDSGMPQEFFEPGGNIKYGPLMELVGLGITYAAVQTLIPIIKVGGGQATKMMRGVVEWWNRGRNIRVPGENNASFWRLFRDDMKQGGKFSGGTGTWYPRNWYELRQMFGLGPKGDRFGGILWSFTQGLKTGPTPLGRQVFERSIKMFLLSQAAPSGDTQQEKAFYGEMEKNYADRIDAMSTEELETYVIDLWENSNKAEQDSMIELISKLADESPGIQRMRDEYAKIDEEEDATDPNPAATAAFDDYRKLYDQTGDWELAQKFYDKNYIPAAQGKKGYGGHKSANEIAQGFKDRRNAIRDSDWLQKAFDQLHRDHMKEWHKVDLDDLVSMGTAPVPVKDWGGVDGSPIASDALGVGDETTAASVAGERKKKKNNQVSVEVYKPKGRRLQESDLNLSRRQVRLLKEIKKPVLVEELPQQKLKKYKPNFKGKYSPQNTPDKTASKESDALVMSGNQKGQAWRTQDKYWSGYETQERMNVIVDRVGHGDLAWQMIVDEAREKNGWKNREVQEHLNIIAAEKGMREQVPDYESPFGYVIHEQGASTEEELDTVMKDPLVKKVAKRLRTQIDYKDKPSRKGFPDEPPAKQQDGWHPEYGKKYKYDKLDPQSAEAMPPTGNPEIDANVEKAKPKKPKWKHINTESKVDPKVKWEESVDWRNEIEINNSESLIEVENLDDFYERKQKLNERMTTSSVFSYALPGSDELTDINTTTADAFEDSEDNSLDNIMFRATDIEASGTGSGDDGGFNIGPHLRFGTTTNSDGSAYQGTSTRHAFLKPIDARYIDTMVVTAIRGNGSNGGHLPTSGHNSGQDLRLMWFNEDRVDGWNNIGSWMKINVSGKSPHWTYNKNEDGSDVNSIIVPRYHFKLEYNNEYDLSDPEAYPELRDWVIKIPEWCRNKNQRFAFYQQYIGSGMSHYGIKAIKYQRRSPMNVVVPLDDPQATAFVRLGQGNEISDPKKRKKKVDKILKASKEYVNKIVADPFPGTEAEIGEAQGTSGNEYVPQAWDNKKQEFADAGTLDQQKDKFVSKDVKLPPTYSQVQKAKKKK